MIGRKKKKKNYYLSTLKYQIKGHACLLIFNILPLLLVYYVYPKKTQGTAIL